MESELEVQKQLGRTGRQASYMRCACYAVVLLWGMLAGGAFISGQQDEGDVVVAIATIHGEINRAQVVHVRRAIESAQEQNARYLVIEIDTFGGRVDSALQITTLIGSLQDIQTIAFVPVTSEGTGVSWSAGALISLACDQIFMSPGTSIGAATPVTAASDGSVAAGDEKILSAVRTQMAAIAEKNGYSLGIALAMVDRDVELFEVRRDGELLGAFTQNEYDALDNQDDALQKGAIVSPVGKLLTLTAGQMQKYGVSSGSPSSYSALYDILVPDLAVQEIRMQSSGLDSLVAFLTSSAVVSLLIAAGLIGIFVEITSPGFGLPGALGVLAFAIVFGANFLLGRVESLELVLLLCGVILVGIEVLLIPGFGVAGVGGIVLVALSLILAQQSFGIPQFGWQWSILGQNIVFVIAAIVVSITVFIMLTPTMSKGRFFRRIALLHTEDNTQGYTVQSTHRHDELVSRSGVTITVLRPSGRARFGDEVLGVESEGEFIDSGVSVSVIRVDSNRIIVRKG